MEDINLISPNDFQYKNITISGMPGAGSTTLLKALKEFLKDTDWQGFSGGEFMRSYAEEKGLFDKSSRHHHDASHYEDDFDRKIDYGMREKLETGQHWILESWLSGFMAQEVEGTFKILMVCNNKAVKVDRVVNRDGVTPDQAVQNMQERYQNNLSKWRRIYKDQWQEWVVEKGKVKASDPIDFWRPELYDVVVDTYSHNQIETLQLVLHAITKKKDS